MEIYGCLIFKWVALLSHLKDIWGYNYLSMPNQQFSRHSLKKRMTGSFLKGIFLQMKWIRRWLIYVSPIITNLMGISLMNHVNFMAVLQPGASVTNMDQLRSQHGYVITYPVMCDEITYPFPNCNDGAVAVWELISKFNPWFIMDAIAYPCWG